MAGDVQISDTAIGGPPHDYTVPGSADFILKTVQATFDGTGAAGTFVPVVELISDSGHLIGRGKAEASVAAGVSASVSFFPFSGTGFGAGGGYVTIEDQGVALPQESILNFTGAGVTATDDPGNSRTDVAIPGATVVAGTWVAPIFGLLPAAAPASPLGSGVLYGARFVVPFTSTMHDLTVFPTAVSGNINLGIYDTSAGTRNRLYQSGAVSMGAAVNNWVTYADPAISLTQGQQIDLVAIIDNNTGAIEYNPFPTNGYAGAFPPGFLVSPQGGVSYMAWKNPASGTPGGSTIPATISEASLTPWASAVIIIARLV